MSYIYILDTNNARLIPCTAVLGLSTFLLVKKKKEKTLEKRKKIIRYLLFWKRTFFFLFIIFKRVRVSPRFALNPGGREARFTVQTMFKIRLQGNARARS